MDPLPSADDRSVARRPSLQVRPAAEGDLAAIASIYAEGIHDRIATFETQPRTPAELRPWLTRPQPLLVAVAGAQPATPLGFATAAPVSERACYAGVAEASVYVARAERGQGVGHALLTALLPACEAVGAWKLLGGVFPENTASLALLQRHGFRVVGTYRRHGMLDGVWRDVVLVERLLGAARAT